MSISTEEKKRSDTQIVKKEEYIAGTVFDHTVKHTDAYYEQYIKQFVPTPQKSLTADQTMKLASVGIYPRNTSLFSTN